MESVRINNRRHRTARQNTRDKALSRLARLSAQAGPEDDRIGPLDSFQDLRLRRLAERGLDGQDVREAGLRRSDRLAGGHERHQSGPGGKGATGGMERGAAHPICAADDTDATAIALMHLRCQAWY